MSSSDFKLGRFLGSVPVLNWPAKALRWLSGVSDLAETIPRDPENPFRYYRLAMRYDWLVVLSGGWRVVRAVITAGHSEIARAVVGSAVRAVDGEDLPPQVLLLLNVVALAHKQLRFDPSNDALLLLLGAASLQIGRRTDDLIWEARAARAFLLVMMVSKNRYRISDAAVGLWLIYKERGAVHLASRYKNLARRLGNDCSLLNGDSRAPSIWDVGATDPRQKRAV